MLLVQANEPDVFLGCLKRVAERKAFANTRGNTNWDEAQRWQEVVDVVEIMQQKLQQEKKRAV